MPFNDPERGRTFSAQTPSTAKELIEAHADAIARVIYGAEVRMLHRPEVKDRALKASTAALRALLPKLREMAGEDKLIEDIAMEAVREFAKSRDSTKSQRAALLAFLDKIEAEIGDAG